MHVAARGTAQPKKPFMLVLAPTRELAVQTQQVCEAAGKCINVRSVCVFGGVAKVRVLELLLFREKIR